MTRQSCVSFYQAGSVVEQIKLHFLSIVSFYFFCPLELSIYINAVGNPINKNKKKKKIDGRCASVKSIVSRADINYVFLIYIFSWTDVSHFWQKKDHHTGVDSIVDGGHRVLVISSGTMNRTDSHVEEKEKEKLNVDSICSASSLSLFSSCCLPERKNASGTIRTRLWKKMTVFSFYSRPINCSE